MNTKNLPFKNPVYNTSHGWRSRGYLPHFDNLQLTQLVTFRLNDSLPQNLIEQIRQEMKLIPDELRSARRTKRIEQLLNKGLGKCSLRDPRIAEMVKASLINYATGRYILDAYVIMPNHVHILITLNSTVKLWQIVKGLKRYTARKANLILTLNGIFWEREYHDRYIRNYSHFNIALNYIHQNPVKAGLVQYAEDWPYSSCSMERRHFVGQS